MKELEETKNTLQQAGQDLRTTINATVEQVETPAPSNKSESRTKDPD